MKLKSSIKKIVSGKNYEKSKITKSSQPIDPQYFPLEGIIFGESLQNYGIIPDFMINSFCSFSNYSNIILMERKQARIFSSNIMFLTDCANKWEKLLYNLGKSYIKLYQLYIDNYKNTNCTKKRETLVIILARFILSDLNNLHS